jgi:hypothetical protein
MSTDDSMINVRFGLPLILVDVKPKFDSNGKYLLDIKTSQFAAAFNPANNAKSIILFSTESLAKDWLATRTQLPSHFVTISTAEAAIELAETVKSFHRCTHVLIDPDPDLTVPVPSIPIDLFIAKMQSLWASN